MAGTQFKDRILPRDVATRWNSTYDMMVAFIEMKTAVVQFLDCASNGLSEYMLSEEEWEAASDLTKALKVCIHILHDAHLFTIHHLHTQGCNNVLFIKLIQHFSSHSGYGHY